MMRSSLFISSFKDNQKKIIGKIYKIGSLFLAILLTAYLFVHISYMYRGYPRLMEFYGLKSNTVDVVFVGTSVTFSSFMPMEAWNQYGMASFNYCTNVQFENSLRYSVREIVKTQSPKLIMIDIAPFLYEHYAGAFKNDDDKYIKYNLDSVKYSWDRAKLTAEINKDIDGDIYSYLYYFFDIFHYHTNTISINQYNNTLKDCIRGYGYLQRNQGEIIDFSNIKRDDGSITSLGTIHEKYLKELIAETDKLECDVVYYCGPILFNQLEQFGRKNYIKKVIEDAGYTFWDFSENIEDIGLNYKTDFWSRDHFDAFGAAKVTSYLAEKIKENYEIPDRRNDPNYSYWNDDYIEWEKLKKNYEEKDIGINEITKFEQYIDAIAEAGLDAVIEIIDSDALLSLDEKSLEQIGVSAYQITKDTEFLVIKDGRKTTVLNNCYFPGSIHDTVLGSLSLLYDKDGNCEIYLNDEECLMPSGESYEDADFRIRLFVDNDLEQTLDYVAITLQSGNIEKMNKLTEP